MARKKSSKSTQKGRAKPMRKKNKSAKADLHLRKVEQLEGETKAQAIGRISKELVAAIRGDL
jgi:hypothetical protein